MGQGSHGRRGLLIAAGQVPYLSPQMKSGLEGAGLLTSAVGYRAQVDQRQQFETQHALSTQINPALAGLQLVQSPGSYASPTEEQAQYPFPATSQAETPPAQTATSSYDQPPSTVYASTTTASYDNRYAPTTSAGYDNQYAPTTTASTSGANYYSRYAPTEPVFTSSYEPPTTTSYARHDSYSMSGALPVGNMLPAADYSNRQGQPYEQPSNRGNQDVAGTAKKRGGKGGGG